MLLISLLKPSLEACNSFRQFIQMSLCYELGLTCLVDSLDMSGLLFSMTVEIYLSLLLTFICDCHIGLDLCIYCIGRISHTVLSCKCRLNCHRVLVGLFDLICHAFLIRLLDLDCHAFLICLDDLSATAVFRRKLNLI